MNFERRGSTTKGSGCASGTESSQQCPRLRIACFDLCFQMAARMFGVFFGPGKAVFVFCLHLQGDIFMAFDSGSAQGRLMMVMECALKCLQKRLVSKSYETDNSL